MRTLTALLFALIVANASAYAAERFQVQVVETSSMTTTTTRPDFRKCLCQGDLAQRRSCQPHMRRQALRTYQAASSREDESGCYRMLSAWESIYMYHSRPRRVLGNPQGKLAND
jgi:hypothetical protein